MVRIKVNGRAYEFDRELAVEEMLRELHFERTDGLAVAINYEVTSKKVFMEKKIKDGDEVEIIRAVQGG